VNVLGVGIATLDVVNEVTEYPCEDAEVRALAQRTARGGNATNTLVTLAQLGHRCSWAGTLGDDAAADLVLADLRAHGIDTAAMLRQVAGLTPASYVTLSRSTGSRTIVHHRALAEYGSADFARIDLARLDWVHFEGRAVEELRGMLQRVAGAQGPPCSLEVEKPRPGIEDLFVLPDLLLFGRQYALAKGFAGAPALLAGLPPGKAAVCAWGEAGAWARTPEGVLHHAPAWRPPRVVDTLGAGDVFNAAVIDAWAAGRPMPEVLSAGCRLAGAKCARHGLSGLRDEEIP